MATILIIDGVLQKESDSCGLWMHCEHLNRDPSDSYVCLMCKPPLLKYYFDLMHFQFSLHLHAVQICMFVMLFLVNRFLKQDSVLYMASFTCE